MKQYSTSINFKELGGIGKETAVNSLQSMLHQTRETIQVTVPIAIATADRSPEKTMITDEYAQQDKSTTRLDHVLQKPGMSKNQMESLARDTLEFKRYLNDEQENSSVDAAAAAEIRRSNEF